jgi:hypothetical protein
MWSPEFEAKRQKFSRATVPLRQDEICESPHPPPPTETRRSYAPGPLTVTGAYITAF